jgi:hypothetical protein
MVLWVLAIDRNPFDWTTWSIREVKEYLRRKGLKVNL